MRLLIECTYVFEHPELNSGIQRVVRNVIAELAKHPAQYPAIPVMISNGQLYQVNSLAPLQASPEQPWGHKAVLALEGARNLFWRLHAYVARRMPLKESLWMQRLLYWPCKALSLGITLPLRALLWYNRKTHKPAPQRAVPLQIKPGDQLVLLDSSWHGDMFELISRLKSQGLGVISVIYDLIPMTHSQFCDAGLVKVFERWFDWISQTADGFMAISQTVSNDVVAEVERRLGPQEAAKRWHNHFLLGSELDLINPQSELLPALKQMFSEPGSVYLMVSTVEPRKNHAYLLDSFELLWAKGSSARLCIIGKIGWNCQSLVNRVKQHPEFGKRLFMFNEVNDKSLQYAYSNARSLVFPSHAEGFGLPLVEAMQRNLPVMASDLEVFREIGGDYAAYFDLNEPASLGRLIEEFEHTQRFPAKTSLDQWQWISWQQSAQQMASRIIQGVKGQRA
jgi:glycosyltransferase involved in cell wall biosynthesis